MKDRAVQSAFARSLKPARAMSTVEWDCSKGMHEPVFNPYRDFFECRSCGEPLDARQRGGVHGLG